MTRFVQVPAAAIRERLAAAGFGLITAASGEEIYSRSHDRNSRYAVKVYSSIQRGADEARGCGEDAIRVVAIHYSGSVGPNGEWLYDTARAICEATRVLRTGTVDGVLDRMIERAREAYAACNKHRNTTEQRKRS
jgi:hypothetical protein